MGFQNSSIFLEKLTLRLDERMKHWGLYSFLIIVFKMASVSLRKSYWTRLVLGPYPKGKSSPMWPQLPTQI